MTKSSMWSNQANQSGEWKPLILVTGLSHQITSDWSDVWLRLLLSPAVCLQTVSPMIRRQLPARGKFCSRRLFPTKVRTILFFNSTLCRASARSSCLLLPAAFTPIQVWVALQLPGCMLPVGVASSKHGEIQTSHKVLVLPDKQSDASSGRAGVTCPIRRTLSRWHGLLPATLWTVEVLLRALINMCTESLDSEQRLDVTKVHLSINAG